MKNLLLPAIALSALLVSCGPGEGPQRCDYIQIDNPTDQDYFIVIDVDTVALPAFTFISDFRARCEAVDADGDTGEKLNGKHTYKVLDKNKKQIFDTTFTFTNHYLFINPTRSTYVEWKVVYGDDATEDEDTVMMIDSAVFIGDFVVYNSFAFETIAGGKIDCDRTVPATIEVMNENSNYRHLFYRQADFVAAYNGFEGTSPKDDARVDLYNLLTKCYNAAVDNADRKIPDYTMTAWYDDINSEDYSGAMSTLNSYKFEFSEKTVEKANSLYEDYKNAEETETPVLPFTALHIVNYDFDHNGKPYKSYVQEYDPQTGKCATNYDPEPNPDE